MEYWGVDAADISSYLAVVPAANEENVLTQKYIALYTQGIQAWYMPISALKGDNVVTQSEAMTWFEGKPLLELLETVEVVRNEKLDAARFPVQYVIRPQSDKFHVRIVYPQ